MFWALQIRLSKWNFWTAHFFVPSIFAIPFGMSSAKRRTLSCLSFHPSDCARVHVKRVPANRLIHRLLQWHVGIYRAQVSTLFVICNKLSTDILFTSISSSSSSSASLKKRLKYCYGISSPAVNGEAEWVKFRVMNLPRFMASCMSLSFSWRTAYTERHGRVRLRLPARNFFFGIIANDMATAMARPRCGDPERWCRWNERKRKRKEFRIRFKKIYGYIWWIFLFFSFSPPS